MLRCDPGPLVWGDVLHGDLVLGAHGCPFLSESVGRGAWGRAQALLGTYSPWSLPRVNRGK